MSDSFATLSSGGNAQSLAMANEIVLAYSERIQALGGAAVDPLEAGDGAQDKTLWRAIQDWCETYCSSFINHDDPFSDDLKSFRMFDVSTWRTAAGLNASGFRRSTDGTTIIYGKIAAGDARGDWCFEDLQKGLGALKWTLDDATWISKDELNQRWSIGTIAYKTTTETWTEAKIRGESLWDGLPNVNVGVVSLICGTYATQRDAATPPGTSFGVSMSREYAYPHVVQAAAFRPREILTYLQGTIGATFDVFDDNGDSITEEWALIDTVPETDSAVDETLTKVGRTPADTDYPVWCDEPAYNSESSKGYEADCQFILKWNFTNA